MRRGAPPIEAAQPMQAPPRPEESELRAGETLVAGQAILSPTGREVLVMQRDGNLVLYDRGNNGIAYWATGTPDGRANHVTMGTDGNLRLMTASGQVIWAANVDPGNNWHGGPLSPGSYLRLQEDGNLVIYRKAPEIGENAAWDVVSQWHAHGVISAVENDVSNAVDSVVNVLHVIPGVDWAGEQLKDFASTSFGQWFLRILAGSVVYTGLAPYLGPQLASVGFALPGVAKGDKFASAWTQEEIWRVSEAAKYFAGNAAKTLSDAALAQLQPYLDQVKNLADELQSTADRLISLAGGNAQNIATLVEGYVGRYGIQASAHLADMLEAREDFIVATIDGAMNTDSFWRPAKAPQPVTDVAKEPVVTRSFAEHNGKIFDPLTGAELSLVAVAPPSALPQRPRSSLQAWVSYYVSKGPLPQ